MQIPYLLLQTVLLPIFAAPVLAILGRKIGKHVGWIACGILTYTSVLLMIAGFSLWSGTSPIYEEYSWSTAIFNLKFGFLADNLSLPVAFIMNLVCAACAAYSIHYMEHRIEQLYGKERRGMHAIYYSIYLLFAVGLVGVSLSTNLIELYVFVELALIPSYIMIDLFGYIDRHRIAMMYFIWNHIGAALFLIGVVLAFTGNGGSFEVNALSMISGTPLGFWVCFLILLGWLVKMATFGFHVWLPYAHGEHPTSIAAIIATIVGLGNYVIVRLLVGQLQETFQLFGFPLMVLALITMIYGALLTIAQDDIKRLYACSTISQTAYSLLGIGSLTAMGISGGMFYFLSHTIGKCILFSVAGIILAQTGIRDMRKLGGLAKKMPLTATLCILGSMILSAIPPLSGFQAEWIMFVGIFQQGNFEAALNIAIALIGIFATFLTTVYTFWPVMRIFFGPLPKSLEDVKEAPYSMTLPLLILALVSFILGVYPDLIMHFLSSIM
ncbi:NADH-quinone oxidoreductase subunit M [Candidatus Bathyarchaeota archaeon]|nr:NADH-quinone oxidoreductase subunit M [Candidatus Bathyarchaeota archaeon]